jgi:pyruvate dehydrogenase E1 component alpha subunit
MKYGLKIDHVSFLGPDGNPTTKEFPSFVHTPNELVRMYSLMFLTRALDQKAINMFKFGQIGTYASTLGEEAVDVGAGCAIMETPGNIFAPYYRNQGTLIVMRGVQAFLSTLLFWGGDERGNKIADKDSLMPFAVPIGTQFSIAVGLAKGRRLLSKDGAIVVTGGDGSTSKSDFNTALNEAAIMKLPVVFLIKNNQWAISMPLHEQTRTRPLALRAAGFGMPSMTVDGNDVIAVRHAVSLAILHARAGKGPMMVEAQTYRLADHTTVDSAKQYRSEEEVARAWNDEPLARVKKFLMDRGRWSEEQDALLGETSKKQATEIQEAYLSLPRQTPGDLIDHLFEQLPDVQSYREQRAKLIGKEV